VLFKYVSVNNQIHPQSVAISFLFRCNFEYLSLINIFNLYYYCVPHIVPSIFFKSLKFFI
jgi:hypothetical protein